MSLIKPNSCYSAHIDKISRNESFREYDLGDWFLTLTFDKVFIRKIYMDDMEVQVKNKQQLKLLMQFLGISH
jgi:hypothetical protein